MKLLTTLLAACLLFSTQASATTTKRSPAVTAKFMRLHPCPSTGKKVGACPGWIKDHKVALCVGGPDSVGNLQWQSVKDAKAKDRIECKGK